MTYFITLVFVVLHLAMAEAKTIYVDNTLVADCVGATFSVADRTCTGSDGNGYNDFATAIPTLVAGDTMRIRAGTYTERMNFQDAGITGASGNYITVEGYPGETVIFRTTSSSTASYGPIKIRGAGFGWFVFRNLTLDGSAETDNTMWQIRDGNHDFILEDLIVENFAGSTLLMKDVSNITIRRCIFRNTRNITTSSFYGVYFSVGTNVLIEDSQVYGNGGGGMHFYPGPLSNLTVRRNAIHDNNNRTGGNLPVGGIAVYKSASAGGPISGVQIYDNVITNNGTMAGVGTGGSGVYLGGELATDGPTGTKVYNNTIYGQNGGTSGWSKCIRVVTTGTSSSDIKNNICLNNQHGEIEDNGTGTTLSNNGCLTADSCGTTGKVTFSYATEPFISSSDFRLKQGANPARDAGTPVSTRTGVGSLDLGAYEQGVVSSAVANGGIDVTMAVATPGIVPSTGISGFTVTCIGCSGVPLVSNASVQSGSSNIVHLSITGITSSGSCSVSLGATNMTDRSTIGGPTQIAQGVNSIAGLSVTGTCANSSSGSSAVPPLIYYKMNEGSGTSLNDETANNLDGTISGSPTWTTPVQESYGLAFANDGADHRFSVPYGNAINLTTQSVTICTWVKAEAGITSKILLGPPNGTNMRSYIGTSSGATWQLGVGSSGFSANGESEFPVTTTLTHICMINDASTDTVTLAVNGVKGTSGSAVKSSAAVTALAGDFLVGCGFLSTFYCGGFTVDEYKVWNSALSASDILTEYQMYTSAASASACYKQATHQAQLVHVYGGSPVNYGPLGTIVEVVAGGSVGVVFQLDCTGSAGTSIAVAPYYSTSIGGSFALLTPTSLGADGIALYGSSADAYLNNGVVSGNLSGVLTNHSGSTVYVYGVSPQILLPQDNSQVLRYLITFGQIEGQVRCLKLKQDNGTELGGGYVPTDGACFRIVSRASGAQ